MILTNQPSKSVEPVLVKETLAAPNSWGYHMLILAQIEPDQGGIGFGGVIADGKALVFGFKVYQADGVHFGWCRMQGTNGSDFRANLLYNFDTNRPPVFSEITINPIPWAAIPLGRASPGGPKLSFTRQPGNLLRITYPDWGTRYALRRRSRPKGEVVQVYPGGREGLVATNGFFTVDVPLDQVAGYFELFLPAANRAP